MSAIERFDPEVGVRLPTYAAYWVRAYMVKFLLDKFTSDREVLARFHREAQLLAAFHAA
mgnify:CR=1 FL=1